MNQNNPKIKWYASGAGLARCGPYKTQLEAYKAMLLVDDIRERQREVAGTSSPYPCDIVVWPEEFEE